jgi:hypothetical protein
MAVARSGSGSLCLRCAGIDFTSKSATNWDSKSPHSSAITLGRHSEVIQDVSCPCCKLLGLLVARHIHSSEAERESVHDRKNTSERIFYFRPFKPLPWAEVMLQRDAAPDVHADEIPQFLVVTERSLGSGVWPTYHIVDSMTSLGYVAAEEQMKADSALASVHPQPMVEMATVKSWLEHCRKDHVRDGCQISPKHHLHNLKVIDCKSLNIVSASSQTIFVALSYVWGEKPEDSVDSLAFKLPEKLPATIEDAICVATELGYSYLWIDRYCISQHNSAERTVQINQMGRIYANADLTMVAAAGNDPTFGLAGVCHRTRSPLESMSIHGRSFVLTPPESKHQINTCPWNTRGWTYQEASLSRRLLVFLDREVYLECSKMRCNDSIHHSLDFEKISGTRSAFLREQHGIHPLDDIFTHLSRYTARNLSWSGDILNGMLGIFDSFERNRQPFVHLEGIPIAPDVTYVSYEGSMWLSTPEEQFTSGLCWKTSSPSRQRAEFPSWSWTGWYGAVRERNRWEGYVHNKFDTQILIRLPGGKISNLNSLHSSFYTVQDESHPVRPTQLIVRAFVVPIELQYSQDRRVHRFVQDAPESPWGAFIQIEEEPRYCKNFYLTLNLSQISTNQVNGLLGVVMGLRIGTYDAGTGIDKRRTLNDNDCHLVIVVAQHVNEGLVQRIGLLEIPWKTDYREGEINYQNLLGPKLSTLARRVVEFV